MFKAEGIYDVTIVKAILAEAKFCKDSGAFDVCIEVIADDGTTDWWRGEWSGQMGKGNFAGMQQWQICLETLQKVGLPSDNLFENLQSDADGVAMIPSLINVKTTAKVKMTEKDGKIYYNVVGLGGGASPKGISFAGLMQSLGMPQTQTAAPQPAPAPTPSAQNRSAIPAFPGSASPSAPANGPFAGLKR